MQKITRLDRVEVEPGTGCIFFRLMKEVRDGDEVIVSVPHRSGVDPDVSCDDQIREVNNHLEKMGYPIISGDDANRIKALAQAVDPDRKRGAVRVKQERAAFAQEMAEKQAAADRAAAAIEKAATGMAEKKKQ